MDKNSIFSEKELNYLKELRCVPRLTQEEEIALLQRFLRGGDEEAKMRFVEANVWSVMEARLEENK